jgi:type II secretory pathway component PulK
MTGTVAALLALAAALAAVITAAMHAAWNAEMGALLAEHHAATEQQWRVVLAGEDPADFCHPVPPPTDPYRTT